MSSQTTTHPFLRASSSVVGHLLDEAVGVSDDCFPDGIDPILFFLLRARDEVHRITFCREFEGIWLVDDIFCALHRKALVDRDAASRLGRSRYRSLFEPENLTVF